jgi:hypothetical protein
MNLLNENLIHSEGTFYEKLHHEGYFDQSLFAELILFIDNLNGSSLNEVERLFNSTLIWELAYKVQSCIAYHFHKDDSFKITNIKNEKLVEIQQVLEYICVSFTTEKELDMDFIHEMTK